MAQQPVRRMDNNIFGAFDPNEKPQQAPKLKFAPGPNNNMSSLLSHTHTTTTDVKVGGKFAGKSNASTIVFSEAADSEPAVKSPANKFAGKSNKSCISFGDYKEPPVRKY